MQLIQDLEATRDETLTYFTLSDADLGLDYSRVPLELSRARSSSRSGMRSSPPHVSLSTLIMSWPMRFAPLVVVATLLAGCASRADQVFTAPGRLTTGSSGAQPGYAIKLVRAKQAPTEVVADDGSLCRLTAARFDHVKVGAWIACDWTITPDTVASPRSRSACAI